MPRQDYRRSTSPRSVRPAEAAVRGWTLRLSLALGFALSLGSLVVPSPAVAEPAAAIARLLPNAVDPSARLTGAISVFGRPDFADEGVAALLVLADDPTVGAQARGELTQRLLLGAPRAGWAEVYRKAAGWTKDAELSFVLRSRAASADLLGGRRKEAISALQSLHKERRDHAPTALALGHALMLDGQGASAEPVFRGQMLLREAREALLLATFGARQVGPAWWQALLTEAGFSADQVAARAGTGTDEEIVARLRMMFLDEAGTAAAPTSRIVPVDAGALAAAAKDGRPGNRYVALASVGYASLAAAVMQEEAEGVSSDTPAPQRASLFVGAGEAWRRAGNTTRAIADYRKALEIDGGVAGARAGLAASLLERREYDAVLGEVARLRALNPADASLDAAERRAQVRKSVATALATSSTSDDLAALERGAAADPEDAETMRTFALRLVGAKRFADAVAPLRSAEAAFPNDVELMVGSTNTLTALERADEAIAALHRFAPHMRSESDRARLVAQARYVWVSAAEARKKAGTGDAAVEAYEIATLLAPLNADLLLGLGGTLWSAGRTDEAWRVYDGAYRVAPSNPRVVEGYLELSIATGRTSAAESVLAAAGRDPRLQGIRARAQNAAARAEAQRLLAAGDISGSIVAWRRLQLAAPADAEVLKGLGTSLIAAKDYAGAAAAFREASALKPEDAWARLGEANAHVAAGHPDDAERALGAIEVEGDANFANELLRTRARISQARGDIAAAKGDRGAALDAYREALYLSPDTWVLTGIGGLYLQNGQLEIARTFYREAYAVDPTNAVARRGEVNTHLAAGDVDGAAALMSQFEGDTSADTEELRTRVRVALALRDAERLRGDGRDAEAGRILADLAADNPEDENVREAWHRFQLSEGTAEERFDRARRILASWPADRAALNTAVYSGHQLGRTDQVLPMVEAAAKGGAKDMVALRDAARLAADLDRAVRLDDQGRSEEARRLMDAAEDAAAGNADRWSLVGGTWIDLGDAKRALAAFDEALALDAHNPGAMVGKAGALSAGGRSNEAISLLKAEWDRTGDVEIGLALADQYADRGDGAKARDVLDAIPLSTMRRSGLKGEELPAIATPSGQVPEAFPPPAETGRSPEVAARVEKIEQRSGGSRLPEALVGGGFYHRDGEAGRQFVNAFFVPIAVRGVPLGPIGLDVEAIPLFLDDAETQERGVALSAGLSAQIGVFKLHGRGGVSPLGFSGGPYGTWFGRGEVLVNGRVNLGVETGRAPVNDSVLAWAGKVGTNGQAFGRVARTWFGGFVAGGPTEHDLLSLYGRGGWVEGLRMERVPFWEVAASGSRTFDQETSSFRLGALGVAMGYDAQVDRFIVGEGGVFSPPLFLYGAARAEGRFHSKDEVVSACVGAAGGPQYVQAADPRTRPGTYVTPGFHFGYEISGSLIWNLARNWRVGVDASRLVTGSNWSRNAVLASVRFGPPVTPSTPPPAFSSLGGPAVNEAQVCGR
jgi:tetratricopeptide (TPR) repeat protein